ncbi:MAG: Zn-dependent hydrolase [Halobacterium sp.]
MLSIDADRLRRAFESYSEIGATDAGGLHRLALSDADEAARDRLRADLEALGLDVRVDELGNMFARREGTDPDADPVLVGSHLDSQPYGGRYDGQLGVLVALETLRAMEDEGVETRRPVEVVNWTNEEGARFQHAMLGSGVWSGETSVEEALAITDRDGVSVAEALEATGYDGDKPCEPHDVHAHVELHVEQGPRLESLGKSVGVVEGVYSMAWMEATVHGESDHAGPTPMHQRTDALTAATDVIDRIEAMPNDLSSDAVATVGRVGVEPDAINVIPSRVDFTVDVRSYDDAVVEEAIDRVQFELQTACDRVGATYDFEKLWHIPHTEFDDWVVSTLSETASDLDVAHERLVSGAGHDAKYVSDVAPAAMVFVPSEDGTTHNEAEFTPWEDVVAGAEVYAEATRRLANEK